MIRVPVKITRADLLAAALSLLAAFWVTAGLWIAPGRRELSVNPGDQALFEWQLAYGANALTHFHNPFWTDVMNAPQGVNLAANTAATVFGVAMAPITLTLGPALAFQIVLTGNLAATGVACYLLLSRRLGTRPTPAIVGGLFCAYAPGVVSHANGHLNFTALWLIPLIVSRAFGLLAETHPVRNGVVLGLLIALQYSIGSEPLFFAAFASGILLCAWALAGRREPAGHLLAFGKGLLVAALVAGAVLAYPLWMEFAGPLTYHGTAFNRYVYSEDLLAWGAYPHQSLAGWAGLSTGLGSNLTEENSFLSIPLLLLVVGAIVILNRKARPFRRQLSLALATTGLVFLVLSLGPTLKVAGRPLPIPLPYAALDRLPFFDSALPGRLALVTIPVIGALLALALDQARRWPDRARWWAGPAAAAALLPLLPVPLVTGSRPPVPHFIMSGHWRAYVQPGQTLVPVPLPSVAFRDTERWQAAALASSDGSSFRIPGGIFLGPGGPGSSGRVGPVPRPTSGLMTQVAKTGDVPQIGDADRAWARADLAHWQAAAVVLADENAHELHGHHDALLATLTSLLGPATRVDDVWLWPVGQGTTLPRDARASSSISSIK